MKREATNWIVIHCSATRGIQDIGAKEIDQWHKTRGWSGIGYHVVIRRNGKVEYGRKMDAVGAHVARHNSNSVGVCLVGGLANEAPWSPTGEEYTAEQWTSLKEVVKTLLAKYPKAKVCGHRDFPNVHKACPCFDAIPWAEQNGFRAGKP